MIVNNPPMSRRRRRREIIAGITTLISGLFAVIVGVINIAILVEHNQLINLLGAICAIPGGLYLMVVGAKVVD